MSHILLIKVQGGLVDEYVLPSAGNERNKFVEGGEKKVWIAFKFESILQLT